MCAKASTWISSRLSYIASAVLETSLESLPWKWNNKYLDPIFYSIVLYPLPGDYSIINNMSLTRWLAFSDPIAQTPPPAKALEDIATTLRRDLLLPLLAAPFEEFVTPLLFVEVEELGEDENADRGSVEANLSIVSHSSSHSFSVRISPYCMFWMWDCHLQRLYIADDTSPMDKNVCNAFLNVNSRSWKPYMPKTNTLM